MLAECVILRADRITPAPRTLSFEEAACLPCASLTAWTALNGDRPYKRPLREGDKVLATGTGGVALFGLLFARAVGAQMVMTSSSEDKAERVRQLGAADVIDYRTDPAWGETAAARTGGFDRVINAVGSAVLDQAIAALAPGGEVALMGLYEQVETLPNLVALIMRGGAIRGTSVGSALAYRDMVEFIDTHAIKPPIGRVFALSDSNAAYRALGSGEHFGKIVIRVADEPGS